MNDLCPICKSVVEVYCTGHSSTPFVDGKTYEFICFPCREVPKTWDFLEETNELVFYHDLNPKRLNSVEELTDEGFGRDEAERSIKAVKRALRSSKLTIVSELQQNLFNYLYLPDTVLVYEKRSSKAFRKS